jgi:hypothetical protein
MCVEYDDKHFTLAVLGWEEGRRQEDSMWALACQILSILDQIELLQRLDRQELIEDLQKQKDDLIASAPHIDEFYDFHNWVWQIYCYMNHPDREIYDRRLYDTIGRLGRELKLIS